MVNLTKRQDDIKKLTEILRDVPILLLILMQNFDTEHSTFLTEHLKERRPFVLIIFKNFQLYLQKRFFISGQDPLRHR